MERDNPTATAGTKPDSPLDVRRVREDFPILSQLIHGKPLVYLDNTASTQKPRAVVEALNRFYLTECSNVHRGLHELSQRATRDFEAARATVCRFLGAAQTREIVFTRGTTESINLVAHSYGDARVRRDDEIVLTTLEHHSNIVPWQLLCERTGAQLRVVPIDDEGNLILSEFERLLGPRTRLVAVTHVSNALGTRNPVEAIIERSHANGTPVLLDGAQGVVHEPVDVRALDCDFYVFSGHKIYGPTGIGVLYGKAELLESLPPFLGGGDMIHSVTFERTTYKGLPHRFEAGTPDIAGAIGLGAALEYVGALGMQRIAAAERELTEYALKAIAGLPRVRLVGRPTPRCGVISLNVDGVHPHDVGTVLDLEGIAVRAGHHCAQPLMQRLGLAATVRASLGCYNTRDDIDVLSAGLVKVTEVFR